MSLLSDARTLHAGLAARPAGAQQPVTTTTIDVEAELEAFAAAVEAALPKAVLNSAAINKSGLAPNGAPMVPYAVVQKRPIKASVTLYYNGRVVWAGIEPCYPAR